MSELFSPHGYESSGYFNGKEKFCVGGIPMCRTCGDETDLDGVCRRNEIRAAKEKYPSAPGYKTSGTSQEAAASMVDCAATLRDMCIATLKRCGPLLPDEIADIVGHSVLAIRPRLTELRHTGHIVRTGRRRPNTSGRMAMELRIA